MRASIASRRRLLASCHSDEILQQVRGARAKGHIEASGVSLSVVLLPRSLNPPGIHLDSKSGLTILGCVVGLATICVACDNFKTTQVRLVSAIGSGIGGSLTRLTGWRFGFNQHTDGTCSRCKLMSSLPPESPLPPLVLLPVLRAAASAPVSARP